MGCFETEISGVVQMNQVKRAGALVLVFRSQGTGKPDTGWNRHMSTEFLRKEDKCGGKKTLNNVLASRSVPLAVSVLRLFFFLLKKQGFPHLHFALGLKLCSRSMKGSLGWFGESLLLIVGGFPGGAVVRKLPGSAGDIR